MSGIILVSACLLGRPVRYNGSAKTVTHPALEQWRQEGRLVSICPELTAGLSVPRPPAEIAAGQSGEAVLLKAARVIEATDADVTGLYVAGRKHVGAGVTAALLRQHGIEVFAETEIDALQARLSRKS